MQATILTDTAQYAAHGVIHLVNRSISAEPSSAVACLCDPEAVLDGEFSWQTEPEHIPDQLVSRGWIYRGYEKVGEEGAIHADKWVKGRLSVYLLNESPNATRVAEHKEALSAAYFMTVVSRGRRGWQAIQRFCQEHDFTCSISSWSTIQQSC